MARWLAILFLLCVLPTGLCCVLRTPVALFPDEISHAARADGLRYGEFLGVPAPPLTKDRVLFGVVMNNSVLQVLIGPELVPGLSNSPEPEAAWRQTEAVAWDFHRSYWPTQMVQYFPVFYIPGALGLFAGEIIGLTPLHTLYLGQLAMLLAYAAMGAAAVALGRGGAGLIFATLTLPTAVNLASSYNQDGLMLAACALAAALLLRARTGGLCSTWWAALALLLCVGLAKTPYAVLLLLCLAPLREPGLWRRAGIVLLAGGLCALWLLHTLHAGLVGYPRAPYHPGPLWPGGRDIMFNQVEPGTNLKILLAHPLQMLNLPLFTLRVFWPATWPLLLGGISFGNLHIWAWEYPCLAVAVVAAGLGTALQGRAAGPAVADAGLAALALFGAFTGMELAMYLTFTDAGLNFIEGINARYFLPFMPFFVFLLPLAGRGLARLPRLPPPWFCVPAAAMAVVNIFALPAYIIHVFHMPWP